MTRILFIWAVRHPASAYVQGINDLCAPLLLVFLSEYVLKADMADDELFKDSKHIKQVNRMIKNSFMEKLERQHSPQKTKLANEEEKTD